MGVSTAKTIIRLVRSPLNYYGAVAGVLVVWAVFASPYLFKNQVPFPTRQLVTSFSPWNNYSEYAGPVKNNAMPDVVTQLYPWKHFAVDELKQGKLPVWNPNNFAGYPQLANYQTALFSPLTLLFFLLPFIDAWSIIILLQPLLAGLGMYVLLRRFDVSKYGSLLGSISYMFCGFITVWMPYGTLSMAVAVLPLILFAIESYRRTHLLRYLILISTAIAFSLFSGHFQTSLYVLIATMSYILYVFVKERDIRLLVATIIASGIGLIIASVQLIPTIAFYLESARSIESVVDNGIPFSYLPTLFAPDFFGNPVTRNDWVGFYAERAGFIGIIPLILASFAVFSTKKREVTFFIVFGIVCLLFALDTPLLRLLSASHIPVLSSSNPTRIIVLWSFAFSALSGFGLDVLYSIVTKKEREKIIAVFIIFIAIFGLIWSSLLFFHLMPIDKVQLAVRNMILPTGLLLSSLCLVLLGYFLSHFVRVRFILILLILLTIFDSLRFATKWVPFDSKNLLFPTLPVIEAMKKLEGQGRVFGSLGTEVQTYFGIPSLEGYDPLYLENYGEFIKAATNEKYIQLDRSFVSLDRQSPSVDKVLDFLSVTLIYHPKNHTFQNWAYPVWIKPDRYQLVYEDEKFQLFKNRKALPRARLYTDFEVISDKKKLLSRFYQKDFLPEKSLLLSEEPGIKRGQIASQSGSVKITRLDSNHVSIEVTSSASALLFLSDPYFKQWKAEINGKRTKIYLADYAFRAVVVPKGKSNVEFTYAYF